MKGAPRHGFAHQNLQKRFGGFTIIEVMIVLSISAIMLIAAATIFSGRKGDTEFSQSMYDLQSKFQSYANEVSSEALPAFQQYTCMPSSTVDGTGRIRPVLTPGSGNTTGQSCIYLGQAVQIIPSSSTIYAYPIFGFRTVYSGASDTGNFPSTPDQANPEPAIDSSGNLLLIDTYPVLNGLSVVSATLSGSQNEQDLLTIYSSLQNSNTSGNEISTSVMEHTFSASNPGSQLKKCIEGDSCSGTITDLGNTSWNLCITNGVKQAQLTIKGVATGITTSLNMNGCSS